MAVPLVEDELNTGGAVITVGTIFATFVAIQPRCGVLPLPQLAGVLWNCKLVRDSAANPVEIVLQSPGTFAHPSTRTSPTTRPRSRPEQRRTATRRRRSSDTDTTSHDDSSASESVSLGPHDGPSARSTPSLLARSPVPSPSVGGRAADVSQAVARVMASGSVTLVTSGSPAFAKLHAERVADALRRGLELLSMLGLRHAPLPAHVLVSHFEVSGANAFYHPFGRASGGTKVDLKELHRRLTSPEHDGSSVGAGVRVLSQPSDKALTAEITVRLDGPGAPGTVSVKVAHTGVVSTGSKRSSVDDFGLACRRVLHAALHASLKQ